MKYYTGDLHGDHDIHKLEMSNFKEQKDLTKKDFLIIAGDFGLVWYNKEHPKYKKDLYWLKQLSERNFTTLFVPGNHENYDLLYSDIFPVVKMFDDEVKEIYKDIYMLQTGHIYNIDGIKHFTFGGATSIDKYRRIENVSWWPQEIPNYEQEMFGINNLKEINNEVDVIVTHATHRKMFDALSMYDIPPEKGGDPLLAYLTEIQNTVKYKFWVNGHYHIDKADIDSKTMTLYYGIHNYDYFIKRFA